MNGAESADCLAADVGGTKVAVAAYRASADGPAELVAGRYRSEYFEGVEAVLEQFVREQGIGSDRVCLAIAGVVDGQTARMTNLDWVIRAETLRSRGFRQICLINDLTGVAASLPLLREHELHCLHRGSARGSVKAVLAPGTGLGEGFLLEDPGIFHPCGTEGGHSDFGPVGSEQRELLAWLAGPNDQAVSWEKVCSGPAIAVIYDFLRGRGLQEHPEVAARLAAAADRTPEIVEGALATGCSLCRRTVELFLAVLGRAAANLVMTLYATGGLYLGGGILPRLSGRMEFAPFLESLHREGEMADLVRRVPVSLILREDAALLGAAWYGLRRFRDQSGE